MLYPFLFLISFSLCHYQVINQLARDSLAIIVENSYGHLSGF